MSDYTVGITSEGWTSYLANQRRLGRPVHPDVVASIAAQIADREARQASEAQRGLGRPVAPEIVAQRIADQEAREADKRRTEQSRKQAAERHKRTAVRLPKVAAALANMGWRGATRAQLYDLATSGVGLFRQTVTGRWFTTFGDLPAIAAALGLAQVLA